MDWLAIKKKSGNMFWQHREDREKELQRCMQHNIPIGSVIEKKFDNRNDAKKFCERINCANELISKI